MYVDHEPILTTSYCYSETRLRWPLSYVVFILVLQQVAAMLHSETSLRLSLCKAATSLKQPASLDPDNAKILQSTSVEQPPLYKRSGGAGPPVAVLNSLSVRVPLHATIVLIIICTTSRSAC